MNTFSITEPWWFTERIIREHLARVAGYVRGRVLDVGCGRKRYRDLFSYDEYVGVDAQAGPEVDVVCDAHRLPFGDGSFDSVISNQVLEHVADPHAVVAEIHRVLRENGSFVLSVPFIARMHGVPHDYWRFSEYGIRELLRRAGFELVGVRPIGGFWTTQCYLWTFALWEVLSAGRSYRRVLGKLLFPILNALSVGLYAVDRERLTPFNYVAVAKKVAASAANGAE